MKSKITKDFRKLLRDLPPNIKRQAYEAYQLFKGDPYHPSLHFKRVSQKQPLYSVRISRNYRALGFRDPQDQIVWFWIGAHDEYDDKL